MRLRTMRADRDAMLAKKAAEQKKREQTFAKELKNRHLHAATRNGVGVKTGSGPGQPGRSDGL